MTEGFEHPAHLAVAALFQHHPVPAVDALAFAVSLDPLEAPGRAVVESDAFEQAFPFPRLKLAPDAGGVLALQAVARVHQAVCELPRVGKENEAGAVQIKPPDCNPSAGGQRVEHGAPSLRVTPGDELSYGLVVKEHPRFFRGSRLYRLAVYGDFVVRAGPGAEGYDGAV